MNGRRFLFSLVLSLTVFISACTPPVYKDTERNYANAQSEMKANRASYENPQLPVQRVTANNITLGSIHSQPRWLNKRIIVRGNNLPFEMFVNKVLSGTNGIAVYENDVNRTVPISLNYSGTIKGALNALAAKANYAYDLTGDTLLWSGFVTKTFDISFMPGASQYLLGRPLSNQTTTTNTAAGNVATGFTDKNQYSSLKGSLSIWSDLKATLESMKSKDGQITVSEATTTITVRDRPENVRIIGNYLASMDKSMSQQVALDVQVLEVELNKSFNYGVNWGLVRNFMSNKVSASIGNSSSAEVVSRAGEPFNIQTIGNSSSTLGVGILSNSGLWAGTNLFINAIAQQGKVSVSTQPRVITLNNQVAEIGINRQTTYLAQMTTTQTFGAGASTSLTPGVVSSGFSLFLLPKIQGNNVYLQISSTLSSLEKIDKFTLPNNTSAIQMPVVAEKRFNQRTVVPSGATLILAGFKQVGNTANKISMFDSDALGGKGGQQSNVETIVLITPTVIRVNS